MYNSQTLEAGGCNGCSRKTNCSVKGTEAKGHRSVQEMEDIQCDEAKDGEWKMMSDEAEEEDRIQSVSFRILFNLMVDGWI